MPDRISVRVPATSANLGCLFDCAALALALYLDVHVTPRTDCAINIRYTGVDSGRVPTDGSNLIARTISSTLANWHKTCGFDLEIENQIPVGAGLGSSAAAIVAGLTACHWLADETLSEEDLVTVAARLDGHPDNVAAAWEGGFTIAVQDSPRVLAYSCPVADSLQFVVALPGYAVPTEQARAVLPQRYSRDDAVHNLQRAVSVSAQFFSGRVNLRPAFFDDRWHQPYRAGLAPGLSEVLRYTHPDLLGACLSGAGPAILAIVKGSASEIGAAMIESLAAAGTKARTLVLAADNRGAKGWSVPA